MTAAAWAFSSSELEPRTIPARGCAIPPPCSLIQTAHSMPSARPDRSPGRRAGLEPEPFEDRGDVRVLSDREIDRVGQPAGHDGPLERDVAVAQFAVRAQGVAEAAHGLHLGAV